MQVLIPIARHTLENHFENFILNTNSGIIKEIAITIILYSNILSL